MTVLPSSAALRPLQEAGDEVIVEVPADGVAAWDVFDAGFMIYPLGVCAILVVALAVWTASRLWRSHPDVGPKTLAGVDAVLFWGGFAAVVGVLGTLIGIMIAAQAVEMAGEVHATLVWGGIKVALLTTVFGTLILTVASLLWFGLRWRCRTLVVDAGTP